LFDVETNSALWPPKIVYLNVRQDCPVFLHHRQVIDEPQFALVGRVRQCINAKITLVKQGIFLAWLIFCALFRFVNQASFAS
jgi:hypothetical protein